MIKTIKGLSTTLAITTIASGLNEAIPGSGTLFMLLVLIILMTEIIEKRKK